MLRPGTLLPEGHPGVHQAGLQLRQLGPQLKAERERREG